MSDLIYAASDGSTVTLYDYDGDGYEETTLVDQDNDGEIDAQFIDTNDDGYDDLAYFDNSHGDGYFSADVIAEDLNHNGTVDRLSDDLDFDGDIDRVSNGGHVDLGDANPYAAGLQDTLDEVYNLL